MPSHSLDRAGEARDLPAMLYDWRVAIKRIAAFVEHFLHDIVQDFPGDGTEELVAGHLPGLQVHPGQRGVMVKHSLKLGCTVQYAWVPAGGSPCIGNLRAIEHTKAAGGQLLGRGSDVFLDRKGFREHNIVIVGVEARPDHSWWHSPLLPTFFTNRPSAISILSLFITDGKLQHLIANCLLYS